MAIKLLIGGSPCTFWSVAQKNNRETTAEGLGWELFQNYLIAKEKFKPDYFLYENNKSAAQAIKDQIKKELNVWDGSLLMEDTGVRYIEINSALVSAQNRQRFYVHNCGDVEQPEDRGILLKDILESGESLSNNKKSYCLTASYNGACAWNTLERCQREMVAEPINGGHVATAVAEPIRVGSLPRPNGELSTSQAMRIYSINGKSVTQSAGGGGMGGKTGLYAVPSIKDKNVYEVKDGFITIKSKQYPIKLPDGYYIIRKLTVTECCRLQGMPDWWFLDKNGNKLVSNAQAYKGLGNGWQLDTVKYILNNALSKIPKNTPILLLSMYDGIGTGRRILEELGFKNVKYYAYEIDKYCIALTKYRYPDVIHKGDAFKVRNQGEIESII
jgi:site-specific DNA-cytosine methylase